MLLRGETMIDTEIAWLAGIFDGEGCITISRQKPGKDGRKNWSYRLYLKVTMGHELTINRIFALTGIGTVTIQKSKHHNQAWTWWAASREALNVLDQLRPYLVTKALEADLAFEWGALPLAPRGGRGGGQEVPQDLLAARHSLFEQMRDAKPSARFRKEKNDAENSLHKLQLP